MSTPGKRRSAPPWAVPRKRSLHEHAPGRTAAGANNAGEGVVGPLGFQACPKPGRLLGFATRPPSAPRGDPALRPHWTTEAALRMLMNNLDDEVAENPGELVVYGGIGRAARDWDCFERICGTLRRLRETQTLLVQSGKPVGVFETHADAPRVLIANSNLVPRLGHLGAFQRARSRGADDVRPDDRGLLDLHRLAGDRAGHLRDLRRGRAPAFRRRPRGALDPHGRPGRHGRRAAAGRASSRAPGYWRWSASRAAIEKRLETRLSRPPGGRPGRRAGDDPRAPATKRRAISVGLLGNAAEVFPELVRRGVVPDIVTDQTSAHDPVQRLPSGRVDAGRMASEAGERPARGRGRGEAQHGRACPGHAGLQAPGRGGHGLRQQHPPDGEGRGAGRRLRLPGLRARLYPPAVLPRHRALPLGGAVRRSRGHPPDRCARCGR